MQRRENERVIKNIRSDYIIGILESLYFTEEIQKTNYFIIRKEIE